MIAALISAPAAAAQEGPAPPPRVVVPDPDFPGRTFDRLFPALPTDHAWWLLSAEGTGVGAEDAMRYLPYPHPGGRGSGGSDGTWTMLPPPSYYAAAAIHDSLRDRLLVLGGAPPYRDGLIEVWSLTSAGGWELLAVEGTPPPGRTYHCAIYDPLRDRVIVFGGNTRYAAHWTALDDVWALDLSPRPAWSPIRPSGTPPARRLAASAAYDPIRDRILVFGGRGADADDLGDLWALSLSGEPSWTRLQVAGPGPGRRHDAGLVHDPARDRMVLVGGFRDYGNGYSDVWELSMTPTPAWRLLSAAGGPTGHFDQRVIHDPVADRIVAFVGYTFPYRFGGRSDLWSFSLATPSGWTRAESPGSPPQRFGEAVAYDRRRQRLVTCWGWDNNATPYGGEAYTDTWACSLATLAWQDISPAGVLPSQRLGHTATYDPTRRRMIVIGGYATGIQRGAAAAADVWSLSLDPPNRWQRIATPTSPPPRNHHSAIYDSRRDRIVVFGGANEFPGYEPGHYLDDAWSLSLGGDAEWTQITPATAGPSPRFGHSAIYDPGRDRMIVYGGRERDYLARFDDVWALSFSGDPEWSRLAPGGDRPPGRYGHTAVHDPAGNRMVVFGGLTAISGGIGSNEVFSLRLNGNPSWESIGVAGPRGLPSGRYSHGAAYDALRRRLIVMAGLGSIVDFTWHNDVWQLSLQGTPEWMPLDTGSFGPRFRARFPLIYDAVADQVVQSAGNLNSPLFFDTWFLDLTPAGEAVRIAGEEPRSANAGGDAGFSLRSTNPVDGSGVVRVSGALGVETGVVHLHDVRGRRLATRDVAAGPDGRFETAFPLRGQSGIYFLVLRAGGRAISTRTVVLK